MPKRYLSRSEFAQRIGVHPGALSRYRLPEPDVIVGSGVHPTFGWTEKTVDAWQAARPRAGKR